MKEIKTKPVIKNIKALDKTADVSRRMKNAYIRTKEQTEQLRHNDYGNYVNDVENSIQGGMETVVHKAGYAAGNYSKNAIERAKESIRQSASQSGARQTTKNSCSFQPARKAAKSPPDTFSKTGYKIKQHTKTGDKTVKKAAKRMIKTTQKSVKTAERTARATIKTSKAVVKTTAKTAAKSAQAAKRAVQVAQVAARATTASLKIAVKAIAVTIKATIAAVKGLTTLIAAGGWVAVVIILVICLAGFLIGSVYGVFFSNESPNQNSLIMTEVISQFNEEFTAEINRIQDDNTHDTLKLTGNGNGIVNNWPEILAVYAVRVSVNPENGMEVATLDDTKVSILRGIFRDMNQINYWLEIVEDEEAETTLNEEDKETEGTGTTFQTILHISVTSKSYVDMIEQYGFNVQQVNMLNELMQDEYQQLFIKLISS